MFILLSGIAFHTAGQTVDTPEETKTATVNFPKIPDEPIRWIVKPSVHLFVPLSRHGNSPLDKLISSNALQLNFTGISISRYFGHWGLETELYIGDRITSTSSAFNTALIREYGSQYYIRSTDLSYNTSPTGRFMLGTGYKVEKGRMFYLVKLMVGSMFYSAPSANVALKAINSNERRTISWKSSNEEPTAFVITSSLVMGYRLNNHFAITGDFGLWAHGNDLVYTEYSAVLNEANVTTQTHSFSKVQTDLSVGVGVTWTW